MTPYAILLCAVASVLATLTVSPAPADVRTVVVAADAAFVLFLSSRHCRPARFRALLLVTLAAALLNAGIRTHSDAEQVGRRTARYTATLRDRVEQPDGTSEVTLALDNGATAAARVREDVAPGTRVVVRGRLEPFDEARNPGEPSERAIEAERGVNGRLEGATILAIDRNATGDAGTWLPRAHAWAHEQLRRRLGEPAASVVSGELWGERAAIPPSLRAEFQETGTVHVLVTAGLHLGAVTALAALLLGALAMPRALTCTIAIVIVWLFVWWSGAQLPAVRAATMATAALAARGCGRATFSWNALAFAALVIAFARPASVASASFALSFSCVGAIFACAAPLERWLEGAVAIPDRLREALVLSMATQLGTWPLGAAVFLQFAPYAIAANFAVVPCVALTMGLAAAQLALSWCDPLAQAAANLNSWLLAWMLGVVDTLSALPDSAIPMTPAPAWCVAAYDAALLAAPFLWRGETTVAGISWARTLAAAAVLLGAALVLLPPRSIDARLRITVLDVGQADSIVIQTPAGHAFLVDAGGRLERGRPGDDSVAERVGERTVVPFLLRHGIHALDAIVLSHPHGDHAGGLAPVLRHLRVAEIADGGQRYGGHAYQDALATARTEGVPIVYPRAGTEWRTNDGLALRFIGPSLPFIGGRNAINSNSVAFVLEYGRFRMLFTGDAGSESEERFLTEGVDLRADVLKVGHHGSAYGSSADFIGAVSPRYAIVSVGRHNLFGHPAPSTLATLRRFGAKIYRTDENGAVSIVTDGERSSLSTMLDP